VKNLKLRELLGRYICGLRGNRIILPLHRRTSPFPGTRLSAGQFSRVCMRLPLPPAAPMTARGFAQPVEMIRRSQH